MDLRAKAIASAFNLTGNESDKSFVMKYTKQVILFFLISTGGFLQAQGQALSNLAVFARCYGHLTGTPLPLNHTLRASLKSNAITGSVACSNLLDKAILNAGTYEVSADAEAKLVLNHLYEFHRSWFPVAVFEQSQGIDGTKLVGTGDVYDSTESALALTYALFYGGTRYDELLKGTNGYYALRTRDSALNTRLWGASPPNLMQSRRWGNSATWAGTKILVKKPVPFRGNDVSTSDWLDFVPVQTGELIGVKPESRSLTMNNYYPMISYLTAPNLVHDSVTSENAANFPGMQVGFNLFSHMGGGVFGLASNMILNWGHEPGRLNEGALKMPRRWVKNNMDSLLCTDFPMLRESDVISMVDNSGGANVADFRKAANCVQCHATLDQFASTVRNHFIAQSDYDYKKDATNTYYGKHILMVGRFNASQAVNYSWSSSPVTDFNLQSPKGKIYFRSVTGSLIDQNVEGLGQAASVLSEVDDFYQCAAKRYFQYLTGIQVKLYDRGDPRYASTTAALTPEAVQHRRFIETLGRDLKNSQSLRSMIKTIMGSSYYKDQLYGGGI